MGKVMATVLGVLMILVGLVWTFQGLGYVGGSSMTGNSTWAVIGPAVAGLGLALVIVVLQRRR